MSADAGDTRPHGIILTLLRLALAILLLALLWFVYGWLGAGVVQLLALVRISVAPAIGAFIAAVLSVLIAVVVLWADRGVPTGTAGSTLTKYRFKPDRCATTGGITLTGPYPRWAGRLTPFSQAVACLAPSSPLAGLAPYIQKLLDSALKPTDIPEIEKLVPKDSDELNLDKLLEILQILKQGRQLTQQYREELGKLLKDNTVGAPEAAVSRPGKSKAAKWALDDQTGISYELVPERPADVAAARFSSLYLMGVMLFFFWLAFDTWIGQYSLANALRYPTTRLISATFRLAAFAFIGGALGGVVNAIRSILSWHSERSAFSRRFVWKYISAPFQGAALALFAYALIRGGVAVVNGDAPQAAISAGQLLSVFGIGVLAGYGSPKVFVWLDAQVNRIFQVEPAPKVTVPSLTGKTRGDAVELLAAAGLKLGEVTQKNQDDATQVGKVIDQSPQAQAAAANGAAVDITLASLKPAVSPGPVGGQPAG